MSTNGSMDLDTIKIKLMKGDRKKKIDQLVKEKTFLEGKEYLIKYKDTFIGRLDYYYNCDGEIEFYKKIGEVSIDKLDEYDIHIKDELEIHEIKGGLGSTGDFDSILNIYNSIEHFLAEHPLLLLGITSIVLPKIKELFMRLNSKCTSHLFIKSLYHKKRITIDEFIKAYGIKSSNSKEDRAMAEIVLEYMGYKKDKRTKDTWNLKKPIDYGDAL